MIHVTINSSKIKLINSNLSNIKSSLNSIWDSSFSSVFNISFDDIIIEIDSIYQFLNTFNSALEKLEIYKDNEKVISNYRVSILNENSHPSLQKRETYTENNESKTLIKYIPNSGLIETWEIEISKLIKNNADLKAEIISLLATIIPSNLQSKNNTDIAHRGSKYSDGKDNWSIKDNSLEAFENAGKNGFWGAEVDVIQDANGKLVCSHNAVKKGENPIAFEEYLDVCKEYGMTAIIDMKYSNGWSKVGEDEYVSQILATIEDKGMMDSCVIQTNNKHDITNVRSNSEDARIWFLNDDVFSNINFIKENNVECVNIKNGQYVTSKIDLLNKNGIDSCVWNVNDSYTKNMLLKKGVSHVMSDKVLGITPYQEGEDDFNDIVD